MVTGNPLARYSFINFSSQAILLREYSQNGLRSGVDSVTGTRDGGVWYADAEEMNMYCPVRPVKRAMSAALGVQVVAALVGASVGVAGLQESQLNALAFGVLVPMFGIGMNGAWAARYGSYGPRVNPAANPSNRKIG